MPSSFSRPQACIIYGLETVVSVLLTNTRTRWLHNEREIFNTARGVALLSILHCRSLLTTGKAKSRDLF